MKDLRILPYLKDVCRDRFGHLVQEEELSQLQSALENLLGFDALTREGLASAGIPARGRVVLASDDDNPILIFPVIDREKARKAVRSFIRNQAFEPTLTEKSIRASTSSAMLPLDVYEQDTSSLNFGEEVSMEVFAAFTVYNGLGFYGFGVNAENTIQAALERPKAESLSELAEYKAYDTELTDDWLIRGVALHGDKVSRELRKYVGPSVYIPGADEVDSAGWVLGLAGDDLQASARVRWKGAIAEKIKRFGEHEVPNNKGVGRVHIDQAVVQGEINGDPELLRDILEEFRIIKTNSIDEPLTEALTGQMMWSIGLKDLQKMSFEQLMSSPEASVWSVLALGLAGEKDQHKLVEQRIHQQLARVGFSAEPTTVANHQGSLFTHSSMRFQKHRVVQLTDSGALYYGNDQPTLEAVFAHRAPQPRSDPPTARVRVSFQRLVDQLETFPMSQVPLLFRGFVIQAFHMLRAVDSLDISLMIGGKQTMVEATLVPISPKKDTP